VFMNTHRKHMKVLEELDSTVKQPHAKGGGMCGGQHVADQRREHEHVASTVPR